MTQLPPDPPMPWERQVGETPAEFKLFCLFRDLDPLERSITRVISETGGKVNASLVHRLRDRRDWFERAGAWDEEQDRVKRQQMNKTLILEAKRVATDAGGYQFMFSAPVREFMRRWTSNDPLERDEIETEMKSLTFAQLIQLATITARPYLQMWEAQKEAFGTTAQHLVVEQSQGSVKDPFATDDEYFSRVVLAWQEADLLPRLNEKEQRTLEVRAGKPSTTKHRRKPSNEEKP